MCGISGFVGPSDRRTLDRMVESLHHRGPDASGYWEGEGVSFGMRRLAIIDVATGGQPVFNETGSVVAIFNGEIYNHVELREELVAAGHRFRSDHADSEVIVHLYEAHGLDFLDRLNGMFAIALWDVERRRLLLARDRVGIKPLYFAPLAAGLAFGSEPKALLCHPEISRTPNLVALHHYFSLKHIPAPMSAFRAIQQVRPGEMVLLDNGAIERRRWWRLGFRENAALGEEDAAARLRGLLEDSVRLQMRSDVPIGAYLSGGIDSSSVVALMSRLGAGNINTFTLIYDEDLSQKNADRDFARAVSQRYGTRHHEHFVRSGDVPAQIEAIVSAFDEPFSGVISTFFLTQSIAAHVKVALSGDGADELFGSYLPHRLAIPLDIVDRQRRAGIALRVEEEIWLAPYGEQREWLGEILDRGDEAARRMGQYLLDDEAKAELYSPLMNEAVAGCRTEDLLRRLYTESTSADPLNRALDVDFTTLLPDQVLAFVDRLSMAHSVEVRPPFLDHRLVEFATTLPGRLKISQGRVKHILKEAVRDLLPDALLSRPKEGFLMPINEWVLGRLHRFVADTLSPQRLARHGLFEPAAIANLLDAHYAGRERRGSQIWNILMFQLWWEKYAA